MILFFFSICSGSSDTQKFTLLCFQFSVTQIQLCHSTYVNVFQHHWDQRNHRNHGNHGNHQNSENHKRVPITRENGTSGLTREKGKAGDAKGKRESHNRSFWLKSHLTKHTARTYARTARHETISRLDSPPTSDFETCHDMN